MDTPQCLKEVSFMPVRIAVADPLPVYQRGLMATIGDAGFQPEAPDDLLTWILQEQRQVIFLTLHSPEQWTLLRELSSARTNLVVVAVLTDVSVQTYVKAILAGAATAVPRDASPQAIKRVFEEAVNGMSLLPAEVVQALTVRQETPGEEAELAPREIEWLRKLAKGTTVAGLADQVGYSERAMFRQLRELYTRLNVKSRTEALMLAHERGWL
jgi:DNA-binding NarL/FixJ family response regulator